MQANSTKSNGHSAPPLPDGAFPVKPAHELLLTLPGVLSARIVASEAGEVSEIHLLASPDIAPKQMVRNVESALLAHLGLRVDHRKISIATTVDPQKTVEVQRVQQAEMLAAQMAETLRRRLYFEDLEVRRSRSAGVTCRVTLRKNDQSVSGEAEGPETARSRLELAAKATLIAIGQAEAEARALHLEGCKLIEAFEREFVFVGIAMRAGRDTTLLTGTCEIKDSPETASVLAVLDATNRFMNRGLGPKR